MKNMLTFLLICCLIPSCTGCNKRKGRTRRHEPQPVMLRDNPASRPAEVKQVPQPTPAPQRAPQPTEPKNRNSTEFRSAQMAPTTPTGEPVPYVKSDPGVQYIQEGELAK